MFCRSTECSKDIKKWDVNQVTDMSSLFSGGSQFSQDIGRSPILNLPFENLFKTQKSGCAHGLNERQGIRDSTFGEKEATSPVCRRVRGTFYTLKEHSFRETNLRLKHSSEDG